MILSIIQSHIGIREGIVGLSSGLLKITPEQALMGAVIDRIIAMVVIFMLGIPYSRYLLKMKD